MNAYAWLTGTAQQLALEAERAAELEHDVIGLDLLEQALRDGLKQGDLVMCEVLEPSITTGFRYWDRINSRQLYRSQASDPDGDWLRLQPVSGWQQHSPCLPVERFRGVLPADAEVDKRGRVTL